MRRLIVLLVAAAMFTVGCSSSDPTASDEYVALEQELAQAETLLVDAVALSETIEVVEANETANIEAFLTKDLDALMDTYTDDVVFVDETYGDYVEGKDAYTRMNAIVIKFTDPKQPSSSIVSSRMTGPVPPAPGSGPASTTGETRSSSPSR